MSCILPYCFHTVNQLEHVYTLQDTKYIVNYAYWGIFFNEVHEAILTLKLYALPVTASPEV